MPTGRDGGILFLHNGSVAGKLRWRIVVIEYNVWNFWCKEDPIGKQALRQGRCNGRCLLLLFPGRVGGRRGGMDVGMGWA